MDLFKEPDVPSHVAARLEEEAGRLWDLFYQRNADRFFKDRHYFACLHFATDGSTNNTASTSPQPAAEFPELLAAATVLEVGCGAGNSVFPLLALRPAARVWACDFAPRAVALVRAHPAYAAAAAAGRCFAFVADISRDDLCEAGGVPRAGVDACSMVFVLSALSPAAMPAALARVAACLRPGAGRVLFRDYAAGDLAAERFGGAGRQQRLGDGFYARWDGTRAFFFTEAFLRQLFGSQGFVCEYVRVQERVVENRRQGSAMDRRWVQAVFRYEPGGRRQRQEQQERQEEAAAEQQVEAAAGAAGAAPAARAAAAAEDAAPAEEEACLEREVRLGGATLRLRWPAAAPPPPTPPLNASHALARLLLAAPSLLANASVVELGCGGAALPSLAALRWARWVVATDGSPAALALLRRNAAANGPLFVIERLRLHRMGLPCGGSQEAVQKREQRQQQRQQQRPRPDGDTAAARQWQGADAAAADQRQRQRMLLSAFPSGFGLVVSAARAGPGQLAAAAGALLARGQRVLALFVHEPCGGGTGQAAAAQAAWEAAALRHGLRVAALPAAVADAVREAGLAPGGSLALTVLRRPG
eukprot:scaffold2.g7498.t1